jgi:hypothetical protein
MMVRPGRRLLMNSLPEKALKENDEDRATLLQYTIASP